jgi:ABC-type transporter Mla MlaB component
MSATRRKARAAAVASAEPVPATVASPVAATAASGQEWRAGRLMIRQDPNAPGQAHVIGSLTGDTLHVLLDAVSSGVSVLDLSDVYQVDHSGVRALARLSRERCTLVGCPRWLELWLARWRRNGGG